MSHINVYYLTESKKLKHFIKAHVEPSYIHTSDETAMYDTEQVLFAIEAEGETFEITEELFERIITSDYIEV